MASPGASATQTNTALPEQFDPTEYRRKIFKDGEDPDAPPKTMEDLLNLFSRHKGVVSVMLMTRQGLIIKSTSGEGERSGFYCGLAKQILDRVVEPVEEANSSPIQVIRIGSGIQELIISPVEDKDMVFVILQNIRDRPAAKNLCFKDPKHKLPPPTDSPM